MDEERNDWHLPKMTRRRSNATSCLSVALSLLIWTGGCLPPVLSHPQTGRIAYDVVQNLEFAEIRRYPAGTWLTVPVPNDNYALMMAYGYDMLLKYFEGENLSGEQPLALALPMRVSMRVWNMDATRFASIFMGHNSTSLPVPRDPLFFSEEPEAFVYVKRVRSTDDLRTVLHHAACFIADLCMRRAAVDAQHIFVAYHAPDIVANRTTETPLMDEVWVQWTGRN